MTDKMFEARKRYEGRRNEEMFGNKSPYIYRIFPLPNLFVWKDGRTELRYVNGFMPVVLVHEHIGKPRYCEWGADISGCKSVTKAFSSALYFIQCGRASLLKEVYMEDSNDADSIRLVENFCKNFMFPCLRK